KAMLGVEGGVSVIDREDVFRKRYETLIAENPTLSFEEFANLVGERFAESENRIDYRAFTPRHFEAAAFRNVQILFEGRYDGMLTPHVHYLPLRKDFSNLADILLNLQNVASMQEMANRTYDDLIGSGRYS